jgi:twitching motility protein PilU
MEKGKAVEFINDLLRAMVERNGSDLFISAGAPPSIKVDGAISQLTSQALTSTHTEALVRSIMNDRQMHEFDQEQETNFAISVPGLRRFRVSAFMQKNSYAMVLRAIQSEIPTIEGLHLPRILQDIAMSKRGLVLVAGSSGSGKSSTLAAMTGFRNRNSHGHIVTIEDPIEFVHDHGGCLVTQREIGIDTFSYGVALKNTVRQSPDMILLGEIRDKESMEYALTFAETGHLCISTIHANSANQALDRIVNFFPDERRTQLFMDLSMNLRGILSQRLVRRSDGDGRIPAVEILLNTPLIADLILQGRIDELRSVMKKSTEMGMRTFDQALFDLYERNLIEYKEALRNADSVNDIRLKIKLESKRSRKGSVYDGTEKIALEEVGSV